MHCGRRSLKSMHAERRQIACQTQEATVRRPSMSNNTQCACTLDKFWQTKQACHTVNDTQREYATNKTTNTTELLIAEHTRAYALLQ